ncbi:PH domain-containing protein [Planococcus beigongshangi]|uniref:PH domain-containing protein n=1 Tax=Planococcus beigongshangi TaxID=2782536 RepID=UPI00193B71B9|nr:PH domain-containing protein [Planococcus beigongshangi]
MDKTKNAKRYHPAYLLVELFGFLRNSFFFILFLFILNYDVTEGWVYWAKYVFLVAAAFTIGKIFLSWWLNTYEITPASITLREGVFVKKVRTIAFDRVQNKKTATTFIHNWFGLTSLTLETGTASEDASVRFPVLKRQEADEIVRVIESGTSNVLLTAVSEDKEEMEIETTAPVKTERREYFRSTKKDTLRAAFTSLSFLAIFPILLALYFQIDDFFSIEDEAENAVFFFVDHLWLLAPLFIAAILISSVIGYVQTTIRYGNYRIEADSDRIYISRGVGQVHTFTIKRNKVQAIQIEQPLLKRVWGIVEIKLISAEALSVGEGPATNSLYPFMKTKDAYRLLNELLPQYTVQDQLQRLPRNTIWLKVLRPYYFTAIALVALWIFQPGILWVAGIVFLLSLGSRLFEYFFTRYAIEGDSIQIRTGGFTTTTFITRRERIQEIKVSQSRLQRAFGVGSLGFTNRAKPIHVSSIQDVPDGLRHDFKHWFVQRKVKFE